jgi:pilus assembly protein CpaD
MTASNATRAVRIGSARSLGAKLLAASLATLAMAGCKTTDDPARVAGWTLIDSAQRHPILVSQEPTTHLIRMGRGSHGLSSAQRAQLLDFIAHFRATDAGNSRLIVAVPSGGANEVSAMYAVGEIRSMLTDQGFGEASISVEAFSAEGTVDPPIRVSYMRYVAEPPQCGDWSTNLAYDPMNLPYPNLGCANQRNLAVQIANPADLLGPRSETARASDRRDQVWNKYVKGAATGAAAERELGSAVGSEKINP